MDVVELILTVVGGIAIPTLGYLWTRSAAIIQIEKTVSPTKCSIEVKNQGSSPAEIVNVEWWLNEGQRNHNTAMDLGYFTSIQATLNEMIPRQSIFSPGDALMVGGSVELFGLDKSCFQNPSYGHLAPKVIQEAGDKIDTLLNIKITYRDINSGPLRFKRSKKAKLER